MNDLLVTECLLSLKQYLCCPRQEEFVVNYGTSLVLIKKSALQDRDGSSHFSVVWRIEGSTSIYIQIKGYYVVLEKKLKLKIVIFTVLMW